MLDAESLTVAARRFIEYVKEVKHECGVKPILVSHGDDITTLLNSFALVGFDTELVEVIGGVLDFQEARRSKINQELRRQERGVQTLRSPISQGRK